MSQQFPFFFFNTLFLLLYIDFFIKFIGVPLVNKIIQVFKCRFLWYIICVLYCEPTTQSHIFPITVYLTFFTLFYIPLPPSFPLVTTIWSMSMALKANGNRKAQVWKVFDANIIVLSLGHYKCFLKHKWANTKTFTYSPTSQVWFHW